PDAQLLMLVKPTFELRRPTLARRPEDVRTAVTLVSVVLRRCGWTKVGTTPAPRTGRRGAVEVFVHATIEPEPV
ncbi:MAG: hypothetical protein ACRD2W_02360, partial [Acidimicrobiales bacterium]